MTAFDWLSRLSRTAKERAAPIWNSAVIQIGQTVAHLEPPPSWLGRTLIGIAALLAVIALCVLFWPVTVAVWSKVVIPLATPGVIGAGAYAALRQARIARERHAEQTDADRKRRITESFSKAVEQLSSDKLEVRLGGIYSLERISKEGPDDDYWTVMENLTAFVREQTRRAEAKRTSTSFEQRVAERAYFLWENAGKPDGRSEEFRARADEQERIGEPPPTDIAAVLTVIMRRSKEKRERERANDWRLDFRGAVLRQANMFLAHLEGALFSDADLRKAYLASAHLEGASLHGAHLEDADLAEAKGLKDDQLDRTSGDAFTVVDIKRPANWPPRAPPWLR